MKVCEIINDNSLNVLAHLFYFEKQDLYLIKLDESCISEELPLFLSIFKDKGVYIIGPDYSREFVESRIVPRDRQNLGSILRKNRLNDYDVFKLLMLSNGRCAQDDCSIKETHNYTDTVLKILTTTRLNEKEILIELSDDRFLTVNINETVNNSERLEHFRQNELMNYKILPYGFGIYWDESKYLLTDELINYSKEAALNSDSLNKYLSQNLLSTVELAQILDCSRQYINTLIAKGQISVLKESGNNRLFKRSEAEKLLW